jgi:MFS family permease
MVACRFVLRPMVLPLAKKAGVRSLLVAGTLLEAALFPLLPFIHGPGPLLLVFIAVGALGSVLYWTSFHAYYAALGDAAQRGGQVAMREASSALAAIAAPAIGGWALETLGPEAAFFAATLIQSLAATPVLGAPNVAVAPDAPGGFRAARLGAMLMATDGLFSASFYYLWQIGLFLALGRSFTGYGGAMALAAVLGAAGTLGLGRMIDLGRGARMVVIAYGAAAAALVLRADALGHPWRWAPTPQAPWPPRF